MKTTDGQIAQISYEAVRAFNKCLGIFNRPTWEELPLEAKLSCVNNVEEATQNQEMTPEDVHNRWKASKLSQGWSYREKEIEELDNKGKTVKKLVPADFNADRKVDPILGLDYKDLPEEYKLKSELSLHVIRFFIPVEAKPAVADPEVQVSDPEVPVEPVEKKPKAKKEK